MAHPLVVAGATAEHFGALVGPVDHGARQYMRMPGFVKRAFAEHPPGVHRSGHGGGFLGIRAAQSAFAIAQSMNSPRISLSGEFQHSAML